MLKTCFKTEESKHFIYHDFKNFNDINFRMNLENKLDEFPEHYDNFEKTRGGKLRFYAAIINLMSIRIFVKPL